MSRNHRLSLRLGMADPTAASSSSSADAEGGKSAKINKTFDSEQLKPPPIALLLQLLETAVDRDSSAEEQLEARLKDHWSEICPVLYEPNREKPWEPICADESLLTSLLLAPLVALLCGDETVSDISCIGAKYGIDEATSRRRPGQICGKVFKSGEATYTCRCAHDPTCVLCFDCFDQSVHKNHKYRMHTSLGSGYCDCGDLEAWAEGHACDMHKPFTPEELQEAGATAVADSSTTGVLPARATQRLTIVTRLLLRYCVELLCWADPDNLPDGLTNYNTGETAYQTILFNDETHTYDNVIRALESAILCSEEQAMLLATIVDKEGRSSVRVGSKDWCDKAKAEIQRKTAKDSNPRTEKTGPLMVESMRGGVVAHQAFAVKLMHWLKNAAQQFAPLSRIISEILLRDKSLIMTSDERCNMAEQLLRRDRHLWKSARTVVHQLLMGTLLMDLQLKQDFARIFTRVYPHMFDDYVDDDHDHSMSVMALTVQIFTVPTIARMLIGEENALALIFGCFFAYCKRYIGDHKLFDFTGRSYPAVLRRALYMATDCKYLLSSIPSQETDWTPQLRANFLEGCSVILEFMGHMQGMDDMKRQTDGHQVWESEWETAFNIHLRVQNVYSLLVAWALSDTEVHNSLLCMCLRKVCRESKLAKMDKTDIVDVASVPGVAEARCVAFDVATQRVSVHIPFWRLTAALMAANDMHCSSVQSALSSFEDNGLDVPSALLELPLRVCTLTAQAQAGMWRRNGFSLLNQIHNYYSPLCRTEMYDRDIQMMQITASMMDGDTFLIRALHKFGLDKWASQSYEVKRRPDESSKQVITLVEEFLHLLIVIVGERYSIGLSSATRMDTLKREVIHIVSKGPTPYSKIQKGIADDPVMERISLEEAVHAVTVFRKPTGTSAGSFELKPEMRAEYNPFFYHYSRSDISQAEKQQREERKALPNKDLLACAPPLAPKFRQQFENIPLLLSSDVGVHILWLILERCSRRSRISSDSQLHRALFLIGMALNEELSSTDEFGFLPKAALYKGQGTLEDGATEAKGSTMLQLMQKIADSPKSLQEIQELLRWTIKRFTEAECRREKCPIEATVEQQQAVTTVTAETDAELKRKQKELATEKRKRAMEQMQKLQRKFMAQNKTVLENETTEDCNMEEDEGSCTLITEEQFPVALGPHRSETTKSRSRTITCILCQETENIALDGRAVVCSAFIQRSALFCQTRQLDKTPIAATTSLLPSAALRRGIHVSTCAHHMHLDCWQQFFESVAEKERRRQTAHLFYQSAKPFDVDKGEYQCPLCKRLSNAAMPLLPPLRELYQQQHHGKIESETECSPSAERAMVASSSAVTDQPPSYVEWLHERMHFVNSSPLKSTKTAKTTPTKLLMLNRDKPGTSGTGTSRSSSSDVKGAQNGRKRSHSATGSHGGDESANSDVQMSNSLPSESYSQTCPLTRSQPNTDLTSDPEHSDSDDSDVDLDPETSSWTTADLLLDRPSLLSKCRSYISSSVLDKMQRLLRHRTVTDVIPGGFAHDYFEMVRKFALQISLAVTDDRWSVERENSVNMISSVTSMLSQQSAAESWQAAAYTLRCFASVLEFEHKPLFGAFTSRQRECLYGVTRFARYVQFVAPRQVLSEAARCLFGAFLRRPYIGARSSAAKSADTADNHTDTVAIVELDILSVFMELVICHSWADNNPDTTGLHDKSKWTLKTNNPVVELYLLKLALSAYLYQLLLTYIVKPTDDVEAAAPCSETETVVLTDLMGKMRRMVAAKDKHVSVSSLRLHILSGLEKFLRPCALFFHGLTQVPPPEALKDPSIDTFEPLCRYLGLPERLQDLLPSLYDMDLWQMWSNNDRLRALLDEADGRHLIAQPTLPTRLLQFPVDFGQLINKAAQYVCPSLNMDESRAPTMCVVCGTVLCSQSYCCQHPVMLRPRGVRPTADKVKVGACVYHVQQCTGEAGIFIRIRDCQLMLLSGRGAKVRGCLKAAPYVDEYGETDWGFRRGNPLQLNRDQFARLERMWMHHTIAEEIVTDQLVEASWMDLQTATTVIQLANLHRQLLQMATPHASTTLPPTVKPIWQPQLEPTRPSADGSPSSDRSSPPPPPPSTIVTDPLSVGKLSMPAFPLPWSLPQFWNLMHPFGKLPPPATCGAIELPRVSLTAEQLRQRRHSSNKQPADLDSPHKELCCGECRRRFETSDAFERHLRARHSNGCECPICGKSFSRHWLLQGHIRTHTGEKPFHCPICSKAFADKSNLRAHIQTHSGLKPFHCRRCGKSFALKSYLSKHEESSCFRAVALAALQPSNKLPP